MKVMEKENLKRQGHREAKEDGHGGEEREQHWI